MPDFIVIPMLPAAVTGAFCFGCLFTGVFVVIVAVRQARAKRGK